LCIASSSSGVGGPEWADLTMNMKRIWEVLLKRAADAIAAEISRSSGRRTSPGRIDMRLEKNRAGVPRAAPSERQRRNAQKPPRGRAAAHSGN